MKEKYEQIHELVIDKKAEREWMQKPFNVLDETVSTDGSILTATPRIGDYPDFTEKVAAVYPIVPETNKTINVAELREKMKSFPMVDVLDEEYVDCDACRGDGGVEVEFYHNGKTFDIEVECPVCGGYGNIRKGSGEPTGEKIFDYSMCMKIDNVCFKGRYMDKLIKIADILSSDTIIINRDNYKHGFLFSIKNVNVLLMPCIAQELETVVFKVIPEDQTQAKN